jgi:hypothetical protein
MSTAAVGIVLGLGAVVMILIRVARREGSGGLGSVSRTWIIENRIDHDH